MTNQKYIVAERWVGNDETDVTSVGRMFQTLGPATRNARSSTAPVWLLARGTHVDLIVNKKAINCLLLIDELPGERPRPRSSYNLC